MLEATVEAFLQFVVGVISSNCMDIFVGFAVELFHLGKGGFVCSGDVDSFVEGKLFALFQ